MVGRSFVQKGCVLFRTLLAPGVIDKVRPPIIIPFFFFKYVQACVLLSNYQIWRLVYLLIQRVFGSRRQLCWLSWSSPRCAPPFNIRCLYALDMCGFRFCFLSFYNVVHFQVIIISRRFEKLIVDVKSTIVEQQVRFIFQLNFYICHLSNVVVLNSIPIYILLELPRIFLCVFCMLSMLVQFPFLVL